MNSRAASAKSHFPEKKRRMESTDDFLRVLFRVRISPTNSKMLLPLKGPPLSLTPACKQPRAKARLVLLKH